MNKSLTNIALGGIAGMVLGILLCTLVMSSCFAVPTSSPPVTERPADMQEDTAAVTPPIALPPQTGQTTEPTVVYRTRIVRDTVQYCADVPDDLDTDDAVVATPESVGIVRPWFKDPYVRYRYFNPATFSVEEQRFVVEPPAFVYGIEGELLYDPIHQVPAVGFGAYVGHRNVHLFGRVQNYSDQLGYQVGIRLRAGR